MKEKVVKNEAGNNILSSTLIKILLYFLAHIAYQMFDLAQKPADMIHFYPKMSAQHQFLRYLRVWVAFPKTLETYRPTTYNILITGSSKNHESFITLKFPNSSIN